MAGAVATRSAGTAVAVAGLFLVGLYATGLGAAMRLGTYGSWGVLVVAPILIFVTIPMLVRHCRRHDEGWLVPLVVTAFLLKLAAALLRYAVSFQLYDGATDAVRYVMEGSAIAESFRAGHFDVPLGPIPGTGFVPLLTGIVFFFTGSTPLGGFLVFATLSFVGVLLFYRALRIAFPDADPRRYATLLFLLPSLLFWPSSVGKDAWMLLTLGFSSWGVARVLARLRGGYLALAIGLAGVTLVRPHMAVLLLAASAPALLRRRSRGAASRRSRVTWAVGIVVLLVAGSLVLRQVEEFFGLEDVTLTEATTAIDEAARRTSQGGSEFDAVRVRSPLDLPAATVTVVFRPFPHEAHNVPALIASLEGFGLFLLFVASAGRLRRLPRLAWRTPYVLFALTYCLLFIIAFSSFGNFGILTRQRTQLFPLLFTFLALPAPRREEAETSDATPVRRPSGWTPREPAPDPVGRRQIQPLAHR